MIRNEPTSALGSLEAGLALLIEQRGVSLGGVRMACGAKGGIPGPWGPALGMAGRARGLWPPLPPVQPEWRLDCKEVPT